MSFFSNSCHTNTHCPTVIYRNPLSISNYRNQPYPDWDSWRRSTAGTCCACCLISRRASIKEILEFKNNNPKINEVVKGRMINMTKYWDASMWFSFSQFSSVIIRSMPTTVSPPYRTCLLDPSSRVASRPLFFSFSCSVPVLLQLKKTGDKMFQKRISEIFIS